jgi:hypothetical protein
MSSNKPREFWINEYTGTASTVEESINNGYDTHVIEYSSYEALQKELAETKAKLWVVKDSQLRTYDGLAQKADRADELEAENKRLREVLKEKK